MPRSVFDPTYAPSPSWFTPSPRPAASTELGRPGDPQWGAQATVPVYVPGQGVVQMTQQERDDFLAADEAYRNSILRYRDSRNEVADDQWERGFESQDRERQARIQQAKDALKQQQREFDATHGLDREKFGFDREKFVEDTRRNDRDFGEDTRRFDLGHGLERDKFGGELLKTGAGMRGAADYFQGAAFAQGVANSNLSPYVQALYTNGPQYGGGTATGASPTPLTVGSLAREMSGQGGAGDMAYAGGGPGAIAPGAAQAKVGAGIGNLDTLGRTLTPQQQAYLAPIQSALEGGIANKGLSYFENMSPGQQSAFDSGASFLGWDPDEVKTRYRRSRPGQGDGRLA